MVHKSIVYGMAINRRINVDRRRWTVDRGPSTVDRGGPSTLSQLKCAGEIIRIIKSDLVLLQLLAAFADKGII